jgi:putative transport protein
MLWVTEMLQKYPELAVFIALGIGYWIGNRRIAGFSFGGVTGSLLAGIVVGWLFNVPVSGPAKSLVFLLFLFGVGYEVGPRFFTALKGDGWRFSVLGVFVPVIGLLTAWAVAAYLQLDPGFSAGMMSGALTQSPAMGTASDAVSALNISADLKVKYLAHIGVADALCYVFGALGVIIFCAELAPRLLKVDLEKEALALEAKFGMQRSGGGFTSAWQPHETRAYLIPEGGAVIGMTPAQAEKLLPEARLYMHRIRRNGQMIEADDALRLQAGDVVAVTGRREVLAGVLDDRADEVDDRELLSIPLVTYDVFVTNRKYDGQTLQALAGSDVVRGVFLRKIMRRSVEIPIGLQTVIERGDTLVITGAEPVIIAAAKEFGEVVQPTDVTDFVALGLAIFIGALIGAALSLTVGGVIISVGTSVGVLLAGIITGYLRSRRPLFGRIPDEAIQFMKSFGLAGFVAMAGIAAGPHFVTAVKESGVSLLIGGAIVTLVPMVVGLWFGLKVLKLNPLLLLGALSGAQTFTAALAAVQDKSKSPVAVIGYSGAYPVAQIVLTLWGTVIVLLMS